MKKALKIIVAIGLVLLIIGGVLFVVGMVKLDWDFSYFKSTEAQILSTTFEKDSINTIEVEVSTANVVLIPTDEDVVTVGYYIIRNKKDEIVKQVKPDVKDGTLVCKEESTGRPSFFDFGEDSVLTIKVPNGMINVLNVKTSTGNIEIGVKDKDIVFDNVDIVVSTGNCIVKGKLIALGNINIKTSTGNIRLDGSMVGKDITLDTSTGNINGYGKIDFDSINIKTSTGDVELYLVYSILNYTYSYETSTGESDVPAFEYGSKVINVKTSTGDIILHFPEFPE